MAFHQGFLFLLVSLLMLCLLGLWSLCWPHPGPIQPRTAAKMRRTLHRLLKPRCPDDCPACRLASTASSVVEPAPTPVRPWSEVKSRRGAPKRVNTAGFACPNRQCPYFGNTDASFHALVGDGKHGSAEPIQTFRCQACRTTFSARRNTPLYRLKTPSHQVAVVLSALAEGLDPSAAERVFGYRQATITIWLTRAGLHAQSLREHIFCHLQLPYLQLDELRTRLRSHSHVLWLWLVIDPRTRDSSCPASGSSHAKRSSCRDPCPTADLGPWLPPTLHQRWSQHVFLCADGPFRTLARRASSREESASVAGGGWSDLRSGEEKLPATEAGSRHACDAPWHRGCSHQRIAETGFLWTIEHGIY